MYCALALVLFLFGVATQAQDNRLISADTINDLQSVVQIDYATAPDEAGELATGWLRISNDGAQVVTINRANDLLLWDTTSGGLLDVYSVPGSDGGNANMMDIAWHPADAAIHSLHTDGANYFIAAYDVETGETQIITVPAGDDLPVRVWADDDTQFTWVEVTPMDTTQMPYVQQLELATGDVIQQLDSAPEAMREMGVRIGRMPAPLAVTATPEGEVTLWDMEAGKVLQTVSVEGMPMFGHINGASGRKLVWRDPQNTNLFLLDFVTADNQLITPLDGSYMQALLLTPTADVILGVNVDLEPIVVAWDVATGEQLNLGAYRECGRTPDMIQISTDGTTLAIGCDTGLDIWRIHTEGN